MKRVLSGLKPTNDAPTLGNYLGAMRHWATDQDKTENFYFVPNLHALNSRPKPDELRQNSLHAVAWLLAAGIDPDKAVVFMQSHIPAHSELAWILNNYVTMGELSRMTQFKDKSKQVGPEGQVVGLFDYPVLMAADILLYDADEVPVGDDQRQHVEITRDIADRFNKAHGRTFKLPVASVAESGARIMNLQDPKQKMSKSDNDNSGNILLSDTPKQVKDKIMKAVTDSGNSIEASPNKPALTNLLHIYATATDKTVSSIEKQYEGQGYGQFKADLADIISNLVQDLQSKFNDLMNDPAVLPQVLESGREKASELAVTKLEEVKERIGLL